MSTTYGTASAITIPSDGDTIDAADVNTPLAAVWDQHDVLADTTALKAILVPTHGLIRYVRGYGHYVFVTSGTYSASTAVSPWILTATDGTAGRWVLDLTAEAHRIVERSFAVADASPRGSTTLSKTHDISSLGFLYPATGDNSASDALRSWYFFEYNQVKFAAAESGSANGRHLIVSLNPYLFQGASISSLKLYLGGQGHGALPAMMPALGIARLDPVTNTVVSLHSTTPMKDDASASAAAYDAIHSITFTPDQNSTVDLTQYIYYAVICNEGHTNALAELRLRHMTLAQATKGFF